MTDFTVTIDPLIVARYYAAQAHAGQTYGVLPYTHHLQEVEATVREFFGVSDEQLLVAAWLHDVLEDTDRKPKHIAEIFGQGVADLVVAVTDVPAENRKARKALTLPQIRKAGDRAIALKVADRLANVRHGGRLVEMYKREHGDFKRELLTVNIEDWTTVPLADMWRTLDSYLD